MREGVAVASDGRQQPLAVEVDRQLSGVEGRGSADGGLVRPDDRLALKFKAFFLAGF